MIALSLLFLLKYIQNSTFSEKKKNFINIIDQTLGTGSTETLKSFMGCTRPVKTVLK